MKILFTGGSSFTGFWFIRELAAAGHTVTAIFRKQAEEYSDATRRERVTLSFCRLAGRSTVAPSVMRDFWPCIAEGGWDLLCHHAADVTNYKSPDFDTVAALRNNTHNLSVCARRSQGRRLSPSASEWKRLRGWRGCRLPGIT